MWPSVAYRLKRTRIWIFKKSFYALKSGPLLGNAIQWDKSGSKFRSWCGNVHGFHFCQSQPAGVKLLQGTDGLRWPVSPWHGEETLPSISGPHVCPHTDGEKEEKAQASVWSEHVSMTGKSTPCLPLPPETVWTRGNTKIRLCSRLCWKLRCAPTLLEMFCSVCGWGSGVGEGGFQLPLHTVHMEEDGKGLSERVRKQDRSQRGCGGDTRRQTALPFFLEWRKWTFMAFSRLWQLYMRVLLKHLTPLCIQCHVNLAPWLPRQPWCEPSGQATLLETRLQMTGSSH